MSRRRIIAAVVASFAAAGCTHIETSPNRSYTAVGDALPGVSYSLPMLQYDLAVTRTLTGCPSKVTIGGVDVVDPGLGFNIEATATQRYVRGESYAVDYEALSSWFKTSAFAMETHSSGTLKSINASAEDQTGDVIKDVVKTGIMVASFAGGPVTAPAGVALATDLVSHNLFSNVEALDAKALAEPGQAAMYLEIKRLLEAREKKLGEMVRRSSLSREIVACQPHAELMVKARAANREESKKKVAELAEVNKTIADLTALAGLELLDAKGRKALHDGFRAQNRLTARIRTLDEELATMDGALSVKDKTLWPKLFSADSEEFPLTDSHSKKLSALLERRTATVIDLAKFSAELNELSVAERLQLRADHKELGDYVDQYGVVGEPPQEIAGCRGEAADVGRCLTGNLNLWTVLQRTDPLLPDCPSAAGSIECRTLVPATVTRPGGEQAPNPAVIRARHGTAHEGIFVREPADAKLVMCRSDKPCTAGSKNLVTVDSTYAPQLGQLRFLPFDNDVFESNALAVVLREDGKIEKVEYKRNKAAAATAAATAADVATQLETERRRREQEKKDAIAEARAEAAALRTEAKALREEDLAEIQYRIDLLTKQAALLKLETPATPDQFATINEEIARLDKEAELLTARVLRQEAIRAAQEAGVPTT